MECSLQEVADLTASFHDMLQANKALIADNVALRGEIAKMNVSMRTMAETQDLINANIAHKFNKVGLVIKKLKHELDEALGYPVSVMRDDPCVILDEFVDEALRATES